MMVVECPCGMVMSIASEPLRRCIRCGRVSTRYAQGDGPQHCCGPADDETHTVRGAELACEMLTVGSFPAVPTIVATLLGKDLAGSNLGG